MFFFLTIVFMLIGRRVGWQLSKAFLYTARLPSAMVLSAAWGGGVAAVVRVLINSYQPGFTLRWILGYALGAYVAVPNFGLFDESTIPDQAKDRHMIVSAVPEVVYAAGSVVLAFLMPQG